MQLWSGIWALLLVCGTFKSIAAQELVLENGLEDSDVTAEGILTNTFSVEEFIGNDEVLAFLKEDRDILYPGKNPEMRQKLKEFNDQMRDSKQALAESTFDDLEAELFKLNEGFEAIYQRLLHFSRVLVSLTQEDMLAMADILTQNEDYYNQIMDSNDLDNVPGILQKRLFADVADEINEALEQAVEDTTDKESQEAVDVPESIDMEAEFKQYWDPDADYELLQDFMLEDVSSLTPDEKLNDLVQTAGILKKMKGKTQEVKYKIALLLKLFKMKKLLKSKKSLACLALIKTIEKIKRCLKHIKICIIIKIKKFPWNLIRKIKILIRLLIKILLRILWELQFLICELLYKLYFLLKKLKKIPIAIVMYLKKLCDKDGWDDDDDDWDDYDEDWDDWNDWDDDWDDDDDGFIAYSYSPTLKTPTEIDEIFDGIISKSEKRKIDENSFNFDFEFDFNEDIDSRLDSIELAKRQLIENEYLVQTLSAISNTTYNSSLFGNLSSNSSIPSNLTDYDSRGSTTGAGMVGAYICAFIFIFITKILFS